MTVSHCDNRAAAEAHLIDKGFKSGPTRWYKGDLFATIHPTSMGEVVRLFIWQDRNDFDHFASDRGADEWRHEAAEAMRLKR